MRFITSLACTCALVGAPALAHSQDFTLSCREGTANLWTDKITGPMTISFDGRTLTTTRTQSDGSQKTANEAVKKWKSLPAATSEGISVAIQFQRIGSEGEAYFEVISFEPIGSGSATVQSGSLSADGMFTGATGLVAARSCLLRK